MPGAASMMDQSLLHVVEKHPIGDGLKAFRDSFTPNAIERLSQEELQNCILILLSALQLHPAARLLRSNNGSSVFSEISSLSTLITSDASDADDLMGSWLATQGDGHCFVAASCPRRRQTAFLAAT
ncbi:uncharacterized protein MAM_07933 [Metarhizium album ARSEF 1941]|uniref:Uncharacterized protein n=1 Tax=Metarhizium album (strain ARSEF 1941) TaxID=1081103 RepID=A0A0B2WEB9_METAS|nr:uncharacterized protein MAM_07933 [Metarhizium album ARSEF 1941]KHN94196.1 hypothetical protein MAM_07933 [Metarhizium album ARSEF 1941]